MYRSCAQIPSSTGFTAINHCRLQSISPPQSSTAAQPRPDKIKLCTRGKASRRRNPTVACYLGRGDLAEPSHLARYAPAPDGHTSQPLRKRRAQRNEEKASTRKWISTDSRKAPTQKHISESLCGTEHAAQSTTYKLDGPRKERLPTSNPTVVPEAFAPGVEQQQTDRQELLPGNTNKEGSYALLDGMSLTRPVVLMDDDDEFDQLCFDFEPSHHATDNSMHPAPKPKPIQRADSQCNVDDFDDDDLMDDDLLDLTTDAGNGSSSLDQQSSSSAKIDVVDECLLVTQTSGMSAGDASFLDEDANSSKHTQKKFVSPVTPTTRLLASTSDEPRKPIVRPAFPAAVRDRSPVVGLSSSTVLRTCFRVGEAINQSCQANKNGNSILIELYTRVLYSERDDLQQRFTFCDLFHTKPPYIQAVYGAAIWKSVELFEYDSARLLQQGRICRCMGTMKRDGKDWIMTVLNVWEATWDDVEWVEGIVAS
ncbi:hypothetical protein EKO04_004484 [Ascochyta lentis]|uniref:Uncharacterized protein n=1 Tax=Ascochyta lentis TaxID=205686 RepID=A0A8H7MK37_9PLEO|nr:hypothetical protein EKO04_004484 [Ascochyta lentis]